MELTVCMIARNEEKKIRKCLKALKPYQFEIVFVDTGSSDRTREIADEFQVKRYEYKWTDDFGAAKNFALEQASHDMILFIDCDEVLLAIDPDEVCRDIMENYGKAGQVYIRNMMNEDGGFQSGEWVSRVFSRSLFRYEGRIHEQLVRRDGKEFRTWRTGMELLHSGYQLTKEEWRKKSERNLRILTQELKSCEEKQDTGRMPYILYQMGKSSYTRGCYEDACVYFEKGLGFDLNPKLTYVIDMVETYGYALLHAGRAKEALCLDGVREEFGGTADFCFLMGLVYMNNELFEEALDSFQQAVKFDSAKVMGANSFLAYYNMGVICECLGNIGKAKEYYLECSGYEKAKAGLQRLESGGEK